MLAQRLVLGRGFDGPLALVVVGIARGFVG